LKRCVGPGGWRRVRAFLVERQIQSHTRII
jgi:hypothetical protein